jgi:SUN domain-containing protein 1/2
VLEGDGLTSATLDQPGTAHKRPALALLPETAVGQCWPFRGPNGSLAVRLVEPLQVTAVTLDHSAPHVALHGRLDVESGAPSPSSSAPHRFSLYGLTQPRSEEGRVLLGGFAYDAAGPVTQTFFLPPASRALGRPFHAVQLVVHDNHGADFTCLYRVRVAGVPSAAGHVNSAMPWGIAAELRPAAAAALAPARVSVRHDGRN